jgi:hypothetical protein
MNEIDGLIVEDVRNFLFSSPTMTHLLDLACLNLQRGRDHGIGDYNFLRVSYGLSGISSFSNLPMPEDVKTKIENIYDTVNDIDPWVGAITENHLPGKNVGELLNAILTDQFTRLRDGDRFWFENNDSLSIYEKNQIKETTLSNILTRNTAYVYSDDVFHTS